MTKMIFAIVMMMTLVSCGGGGQSEVSVQIRSSLQIAGATAGSHASGGMMLWGVSTAGQRFAKALAGDNLSLTLPNADWRFYAMAWANGAGRALDGSEAVRCALSPVTSLSGGEVVVNLDLNRANCNQAIFRGPASDFQRSIVEINSCEGLTNYTGLGSLCHRDRAFPGRVSDSVPMGSVRVTLKEYSTGIDGVQVASPGLSQCVQFDGMGFARSGGATGILGLALPLGNGPFAIDFEYFLSSFDCDSTIANDSIVKSFPQGLANQTGSRVVAGVDVNGDSLVRLGQVFLDPELCASGRSSKLPFAGGEGSYDSPYLICSAPQLLSVLDQDFSTDKSFRLAASVNLNPYTKGIVSDSTVPSMRSCWEVGQTWSPIGMDFDGGCAPLTPMYSGSFDGNGHTITGMRMRHEDHNDIGFIGHWDSSTEGVPDQFIRDLNFRDIEVSGAARVGGVVGYKSSSSEVFEINNVHVFNGFVESRDRSDGIVGAIGGHLIDTNLMNVRAENLAIRFEIPNSAMLAYAGGIVGFYEGLGNTLKVSGLHSRVLLSQRDGPMNNEPNQYIGGVFGKFVGPSMDIDGLSDLSHEGIIVIHEGKVGGVAGYLQSNQPLNRSYSNSAITVTNTEGYIAGGLVGSLGSGTAITNSYVAGSFMNYRPCAGCILGYVTGEGSNDPGSTNIIVSTVNYPPATGGDLSMPGGVPALVGEDGVGVSDLQKTGLAPVDALAAAGFIHVAGDIPRLLTEKHACSAAAVNGVHNRQPLASQRAGGRGSSTNPLTICNKQQFEELASVPSGNHVHILSGINLGGLYSPPNSIATNVTLDGRRGFVYGYTVEGDASSSEKRAPILSNSGVIKNLRLANINSEVGVGALNEEVLIAGAVAENLGTLDQVVFLSGQVSSDHFTANEVFNGGLVAANQASGTIRGSRFYGLQRAGASLGGLVSLNHGLITDSVYAGTIVRPFTPSAAESMGGLVYQNRESGVLRRSESRGNFRVMDSATEGVFNEVGGIAFGNLGLIEDIHLQNYWQVDTLSIVSGVVVNDSTGVIRRVYDEGRTTGGFDLAEFDTGVGTTGLFSAINNGTIEGVYSLIPGGGYLGETDGTYVTCTANELTLNLASPDIDGSIGTYFGTYLAEFGTVRHVWVVVENNGDVKLARITGMTSNEVYTIEQNCTDLNLTVSSRVAFIHDYRPSLSDAFPSPGNDYSGILYPQEVSEADFTNPVWSGQYLAPDLYSDDMDLMLDFFLAQLMNTSEPSGVPPWSLEEPWDVGGNPEMSLLRVDWE